LQFILQAAACVLSLPIVTCRSLPANCWVRLALRCRACWVVGWCPATAAMSQTRAHVPARLPHDSPHSACRCLQGPACPGTAATGLWPRRMLLHTLLLQACFKSSRLTLPVAACRSLPAQVSVVAGRPAVRHSNQPCIPSGQYAERGRCVPEPAMAVCESRFALHIQAQHMT
jgi:hypothetical protein